MYYSFICIEAAVSKYVKKNLVILKNFGEYKYNKGVGGVFGFVWREWCAAFRGIPHNLVMFWLKLAVKTEKKQYFYTKCKKVKYFWKKY